MSAVFVLSLYEEIISVHQSEEGAREEAERHQRENIALGPFAGSPLEDYSIQQMDVRQ